MWHDLRYAYRNLSKTPGFWGVAVTVLALGIGANTTIYSLIRALVFAPIEAIASDRVAVLFADNAPQGRVRSPVSHAGFLEISRQAGKIESFTAFERRQATLTGAAQAENLAGTAVLPNFFEFVNARVALGRSFRPADAEAAGSPTVILAHGLWQRLFAGDREVIGRVVQLDGMGHTIIGVAASGVWFPAREVQYWIPLQLDPVRQARGLRVLAKWKAGSFLPEVNQELAAINVKLAAMYPETERGWSYRFYTMYEGMVSDNDKLAIVLVYVVAGGILLIALANVANLLLARSIGRRRETAVRLALGARKWRLVRLSLAECVWMALPAALAGVLLSYWSSDLLVHSFPTGVAVADNPVDRKVILFAILLAVSCAGLLPAAGLVRKPDLAGALKEGERAGASRSSRQLASAFVVLQVALALGLLGFSGLLLRVSIALHHMNPGFQTHRMATIEARASLWKYKEPEAQWKHFEEMIRLVSQAPGVESAAAFSIIPQVQGDGMATTFQAEGEPVRPAGERAAGHYISVTGGALETLRIPILSGRGIEERDLPGAPRVAVVNQTAARRLWPSEDALGKRLHIDAMGGEWVIVVGVAADVKPVVLIQPPGLQVFLSYAQKPESAVTIVARTAGPERAVMGSIQRIVRQFDPDQPAVFSTIEEENYRDLRGTRTLVALNVVFGLLALVLSGTGLFGLMSYAVRQRLREIGIRMAMGADGGSILRLVMSHGLRLAASGLVLGLALTYALATLASSLLFGVGRLDPLTLAVATAMLAVVTVAACLAPALRAANADPAQILRSE
jgi:putative ABC transport system permease protein